MNLHVWPATARSFGRVTHLVRPITLNRLEVKSKDMVLERKIVYPMQQLNDFWSYEILNLIRDKLKKEFL